MKTGTPTGTVYTNPRRKQARARRQRREEQEWAAKSGPVTVTFVETSKLSGNRGARETSERDDDAPDQRIATSVDNLQP